MVLFPLCGFHLFRRCLVRFSASLRSSPLSGMRQHFCGSLNALARRDALMPRAFTPVAQHPRQAGHLAPMGDHDVQSFLCYLHVGKALYRESTQVSVVDFHLASERDFRRFYQGSVFSHNGVRASMKFAFRALQNRRFNGRPPLLGGLPWSSPRS
jgi:hypothetical protein